MIREIILLLIIIFFYVHIHFHLNTNNELDIIKFDKELRKTELEKIRQVFSELVYQGLIDEGAEILVNKRITNTLLYDPVSPETKKFNWLESLNVLKILTSRLDLPKRDIEKHFLNKGDTLNPGSLKSGGNPKDDDHSNMVNEILIRAGF